MFEAVAEPVTKVPKTPISGASSGQNAPVVAAASASAEIRPPWTMTRLSASIARRASATGPIRASAPESAGRSAPVLPVASAPTPSPAKSSVPGW